MHQLSSLKCFGMNQSEVILELMRRRGITNKRELARATKLPHSTINKLVDEPELTSRDATLKPLAEFFDVTLQQIRGYAPLDDRPGMPVLEVGEVSYWLAGTLRPDRMTEFVKSTLKLSQRAFAIRVPDDGLEEFPQGEILIVDPEAKGNSNGLCMIMREGHAAIRTMKRNLGQIIYTATNPAFQSVSHDDCELVGYVVSKPEVNFQPDYDGGDDVPRTIPSPNSKDIVDLALQRECRKISEKIGAEDGSTPEQIKANALELYNHCIMTGMTAEEVRDSSIESALDNLDF